MMSSKTPANRMSHIEMSSTQAGDKILTMKEETDLIKKVDEDMTKSLEEALRKNVILL